MPPHLTLMMITNQPDIALAAQAAGVDRIFVDFERLGKFERQGHLDTHISDHQFEDLARLRPVITQAQILARINPINVSTPHEVEQVLAFGTDVIMLPMFRTRKEVARFIELVDGRARTMLLLETPEALVRVRDILKEPGIDEVHVGLNDLHLGLRLDFMFEILASGLLDWLAQEIQSRGIRFGFGGIARIGEGLLPAEKVLCEHARLGSEMVILSRTFHRRARNVAELQQLVDMPAEVRKIRKAYEAAFNRSPEEVEADREAVVNAVRRIVSRMTE